MNASDIDSKARADVRESNDKRLIEHVAGLLHRRKHAWEAYKKAGREYTDALNRIERGELTAYDLIQPGMRY